MKFVAVPLKKPDDTGYPKCPDCVPADVPAGAPLLKVYDYGPHGARFFCCDSGGFARGSSTIDRLDGSSPHHCGGDDLDSVTESSTPLAQSVWVTLSDPSEPPR